MKFWQSLIPLAEGKTDLHANLSPSSWDTLDVRKWRATTLDYVINQHSSRVALYTYRAEIFNELQRHKEEIETAFGEELKWTPRETGKQSVITTNMMAGGYKDEVDWQAIQSRMIDTMIRLDNALAPFISRAVQE